MFTQRQIEAMIGLIFFENIPMLSKRVLAFLINHSERLTKEVCVTLVPGREGYTAKEIDEAARWVETHNIRATFLRLGSRFHFSSDSGGYDPADGYLRTDGGYTFRLGRDHAMLLTATREEIEQAK